MRFVFLFATCILSSCSVLFHKSNLPWYTNQNLSFEVLDENGMRDSKSVLCVEYSYFDNIDDSYPLRDSILANADGLYAYRMERVCMRGAGVAVTVKTKGRLAVSYWIKDARDAPRKPITLQSGAKTSEKPSSKLNFGYGRIDDRSPDDTLYFNVHEDDRIIRVVTRAVDEFSLFGVSLIRSAETLQFRIQTPSGYLSSVVADSIPWIYWDYNTENLGRELVLSSNTNGRYVDFMVHLPSGRIYRCTINYQRTESNSTNNSNYGLSMQVFMEKDEFDTEYYYQPVCASAIPLIEVRSFRKRIEW